VDGPQQPTRWQTMGARGAKWRMPMPPGPPPELTRAEREERREEEERAEARWGWLRLPSLLSIGVIVMCLALAAIVILAALALTSRH
jgi:hypothetical protein